MYLIPIYFLFNRPLIILEVNDISFSSFTQSPKYLPIHSVHAGSHMGSVLGRGVMAEGVDLRVFFLHMLAHSIEKISVQRQCMA